MLLTGKHVVNAVPATVWQMLMDTDTLARIVPGISKLEKNGDNSYISTISMKLGPVSSSFTGNLQMEKAFANVPLVPRSEMEELYKTIYELKKRVRTLEKEAEGNEAEETVKTTATKSAKKSSK